MLVQQPGASLGESVASAKYEVRSAGETLQVTSSIKLALQVLRGVYDGIRTPQAMSARVASIVNRVQARAEELGLGEFVEIFDKWSA